MKDVTKVAEYEVERLPVYSSTRGGPKSGGLRRVEEGKA